MTGWRSRLLLLVSGAFAVVLGGMGTTSAFASACTYDVPVIARADVQSTGSVATGMQQVAEPLELPASGRLEADALSTVSGYSYATNAAGVPDLPEFTGTQTSGVLVTNEGKVIPLESGNPSLSNYPAASHVEGKAAIELRASGSSGGTVYHNNPGGTCPFCNSLLSTLLPEGATLRVVPPAGAVARTPRWIDVIKDFVGNSATPKGW